MVVPDFGKELLYAQLTDETAAHNYIADVDTDDVLVSAVDYALSYSPGDRKKSAITGNYLYGAHLSIRNGEYGSPCLVGTRTLELPGEATKVVQKAVMNVRVLGNVGLLTIPHDGFEHLYIATTTLLVAEHVASVAIASTLRN